MDVAKKIFITNSNEETKQLAGQLASLLKGGEAIALYGDLGSGKTTFTQGLARALRVKEKVQSPTFVIVKSYNIKHKTPVVEQGSLRGTACNIKKLIHADLYRLRSAEEIQELGITEYFNQPESLVLIEWPEIMKKYLPSNTIKIKFEHLEEDKRRIIVDKIF